MPSLMIRGRIIAALLLSPFAGALYLLALGFVFDNLDLSDSQGVIVLLLFYTVIGYVAEVMLGIPLLVLFRRLRLLTFKWFLLGGVFIGIIVGIVVFIFFLTSFDAIPAFRFGLFYCVVPAVISTVVFWFLASGANNTAYRLGPG